MDVLTLYKEAKGYHEGHFLLASGRHASKFLQSTSVLQYPDKAERIGTALAALFAKDPPPDFVIGPAMGGIVLAHTVAKALGCRAIFAEKDGPSAMKIRAAFEIEAGESFIAVEDVMTTGGSLKKTIDAAIRAGGHCLDAGCIIDRGVASFTNLNPKSLLTLSIPSYAPEDCPLCKDDIPLVKI